MADEEFTYVIKIIVVNDDAPLDETTLRKLRDEAHRAVSKHMPLDTKVTTATIGSSSPQ
jgi:hypothetical protein